MIGYTIWITGLPQSGKTSLANELAKEIKKRNISFILLDENKVQKILSSDLSSTKYEYYRHVVRLSNVCYLTSSNCILTIVCSISPKKILRNYAKALIKNFIEVYLFCPLEVCQERAKELFDSTKSYYEESNRPNITLDTNKKSIKENVEILINYLERKGII